MKLGIRALEIEFSIYENHKEPPCGRRRYERAPASLTRAAWFPDPGTQFVLSLEKSLTIK